MPRCLRPVVPVLPVLSVLAAACIAPAHAADTISTDRPDFVESSDVVGRGHVQFEAGFTLERHEADGLKTRQRSTPMLLRLGFGDDVEFRVESDGFMRLRTTDLASGQSQTERGVADTSLGVKWRTQEGDDKTGAPGTAWLFHVDIDSGSRAFRGQGLRPSLRYVAEWELPRDFSIGVMPGLVADKAEDGRRFTSGIFAVTLGKAWSPAWHSFVEIAGQQLARQRDGGKVVTFDIGGAWTVNDSLQVDIAASRGLTREAPDWQWGGGVSVRF